MTTDFRGIAAALGNDNARRAFARLALGGNEQDVIDELGAARATKAIAALRQIGLVGADAASVRPQVFHELLAASASEPRPSGVERFVAAGRIDRYPVRQDERDAVLRWALERVIPLELGLGEADVNTRLARVTDDVALLRRYLVDAGMLLRTASGSEYRRPLGAREPGAVHGDYMHGGDLHCGDVRWGDVPWSAGTWTNAPVDVREASGVAASGSAAGRSPLDVTAVETSDAWRTTAYGFVHDTEHALVSPFMHGTAVEVSFVADFRGEFDQAGVFVRIDENNWIKAGVEYADGMPQVGAVVTRDVSDWSVAPVPEWAGRTVTVRASWDLDALTIRARVDDEPFRLVRVVPLGPELTASAGPLVSAPTRAGLTVRFTRWAVGEVDAALH
jgi:regulation of enolase protein 1 (concanavalin A-like superfamily)